MKKRKLLISLLCLLSTTACFVGLSACDNNEEHAHSWSDWTVTDENIPTDTATGKATRTCRGDGECDAAVSDKEYELPELTSEDYSKTDDTATCSAAGSVTYTYNKDGVNVNFDVATPENPEAHNYGEYIYTDGTGHYKVCSHNGEHKTATESHDTDGTDGACSKCGYKATVTPPDTEHAHSWSDWEVADENIPTDTATGKATRTCGGDGECDAAVSDKEYELPELTSEDYSKTDDTATCVAGGEVTYTYNKDGVSVSFDVATPANNEHDYGAWTLADADKPTTETVGTAKRFCSRDASHVDTYELPVLTSEEYNKTDDTATCVAGGEVTYTYNKDGVRVSFDVATPANNEHDYGDYKQTVGGHYRVCLLNSAHKDTVTNHNTDGENGACADCGYKTIVGTGTYYLEAEKFDPAGFVAAKDFLNIGAIKSATDEYCARTDSAARGGSYICGFANGTQVGDTNTYTGGATVTAHFEIEQAATVRITVCARAGIGIAFKRPYEVGFKIDDTEQNPAEFLQPSTSLPALSNTWNEFIVGDFVRLERGAHTIKTIAGKFGGFDLDYIKIEVVGYGTNESGKAIDINLNGTDEQKFEAEWIDDGNIVLQNGVTATDGYKFHVYDDSDSSNNLYIGGFGKDNELYINVNLTQATTYKILIGVKSTNGILVGKYEGNPREPAAAHCDFYVDETHLEPYSWSNNQAMNGNNSGQGFVVNDLTVKQDGSSGIALEAGNHTFRIKMTTFAFDIDYIAFVPVSA